MRTSGLNKNLTTSVWIVYILIVFEILYMISPFAFYYYAAYAVPLKFLQGSPLTSWLTVHLLPHFTYQSSPVISVFNLISWPLIGIGLLLFLAAFIQIYGSKFFRKGTITGGLYRVTSVIRNIWPWRSSDWGPRFTGPDSSFLSCMR